MATCKLIIEHYQIILSTLEKLASHIKQDLNTYPSWIKEEDKIISDFDKLINAFCYFLPGGPTPQHTFACPGAFAGNEQTILLVDTVNQAKQQFREVANSYLANQKITDTLVVRQLLARAGYPGIKLRQVYRHIRYINFHPRRISFTRVRHNSHRIIDKQEALERVTKAGQGLHISVQQDQLRALDHDAFLVIHRDVQPIWACNISTFKNDDGKSSFLKILTSIPLLYLHDSTQPLPMIAFSKPITRHQLGPRCDKKIEEQVFLPSISAYRYKKK
jgi:hypothetical protein